MITPPELWITNYKSFGASGGGFEAINRINVIVGRNNSGKSALLDLVNLACRPAPISPTLFHGGKSSEIHKSGVITSNTIDKIYPKSIEFISDLGSRRESVVSALTNKKIIIQYSSDYAPTFKSISGDPFIGISERAFQSHADNLMREAKFNLLGKHFRHIAAERDVVSEVDNNSLDISPNGTGLTSAFVQILNRSKYDSSIIEKSALSILNTVFSPDAHFSDLIVQQNDNNKWEIYLTEDHKGRIALSNSGSGLKTALLCIAYLHVLLKLGGPPLEDSVFAFEELENNLHPALQRRLLQYIDDVSSESNCTVFLTTHSSATIDYFHANEEAQIIHVSSDGSSSQSAVSSTYFHHRGILDDLDVRASDLLQANGIVWIEGPTDRLYFNKWVDLWSDGQLKEGIHYQCVFYGGRLLFHLSASDPELSPSEAVKILRVNRNAIALMDSDKSEEHASVGKSKTRFREEITSLGGLAWITEGREIENYIPTRVLQELYPETTRNLGQYESLSGYLKEQIGEVESLKYSRNKIGLAEKAIPLLVKDDISQTYDLPDMLDQAVTLIKRWNNRLS